MLPTSIQILNENGKIVLKGPLSQADVRNRNGRIYTKEVLREAIKNLILKVNQQPQSVYAYLEHPDHADLIREDACGLITEVTWDESTGIAYCKVELLEDTRDGKKIIEEIKKGSTVGISTRGIGSLDENGYVKEGLEFVTADIIHTGIQSCQVCRLTESVNTMDDFLLESVGEKPCGCIFNKLTMNEQIQVRKHFADAIISAFKGK